MQTKRLLKTIAAALALIAFGNAGNAQNFTADINKNVQDVMLKVIEWRRHFHQNPELSNHEYKTGAFIADYLKQLGLEVHYPVAKTGVVAVLKGGKPGAVIALRADIDALPVTETYIAPVESFGTVKLLIWPPLPEIVAD